MNEVWACPPPSQLTQDRMRLLSDLEKSVSQNFTMCRTLAETPRLSWKGESEFRCSRHKCPLSTFHLWIFQFLRRWRVQAGGVRAEAGRWWGRRCPLEQDEEEEEWDEEACKSLPPSTLPSATHAFRPAAADRYPAGEITFSFFRYRYFFV